MSVVITERCISCGACEWECPNQAIAPGEPRPVVDEASCTECFGFFGEGQCIVVCPAAAVLTKPEPVAALASKFERLHPGRPLQDTWVWRRLDCAGSP
jgi:ferredoxin